ncbi:MAG: hypothetical protein ABUL66_00610 [Verrucomicrobiota bacterium]
MRIFAYSMIIVGLLLFVEAGCDEYRGKTAAPSNSSVGALPGTVTKAGHPEEFRNAMKYHWFFTYMIVMAGVITYLIDKGEEKSDPLSPEYAGNKALDDWGEAMKKEEERRKPKKP